jgi:hypothetical protein
MPESCKQRSTKDELQPILLFAFCATRVVTGGGFREKRQWVVVKAAAVAMVLMTAVVMRGGDASLWLWQCELVLAMQADDVS